LSGHGFGWRRGGVDPGQQFVDGAIWIGVYDLGEDVGEVGVRVNAVELARLDQRGDDSPVFAAAVGAGEERVLAAERNRADRSFDRVGVDLDPAVVEEAGEAFPARERIAEYPFAEGRLARDMERG
jgi:hypothetical protein